MSSKQSDGFETDSHNYETIISFGEMKLFRLASLVTIVLMVMLAVDRSRAAEDTWCGLAVENQGAFCRQELGCNDGPQLCAWIECIDEEYGQINWYCYSMFDY